MRTLVAVSVLVLSGCTGTPPTPEQINAYSQAAHTAVQDFKSVKPLIRK